MSQMNQRGVRDMEDRHIEIPEEDKVDYWNSSVWNTDAKASAPMEDKDRFDLEQEILACWHVTDDISTVCENVLEGDLSKDKIVNVLIGIEQLYQLKFEKLFRTFEELISKGKIS